MEQQLDRRVEVRSGHLVVGGKIVLRNVAANVTVSPSPTGVGAFIGVTAHQAASAHEFDLGTLTATRFLSSFRFKLWWQRQRTADNGSSVAPETQFLLLELKGTHTADKPTYVVLFPIIEGRFRACLQGGPNDRIQIVVESGSTSVTESHFKAVAYIGSHAEDPYTAIKEGVEEVAKHLKSFQTRTQKKIPGMLSYFGWCTWDAFYTKVHAAGIEQGLKSLREAGAPPGFLIIDDGWQSVAADGEDGLQLDPPFTIQASMRLVSVEENSKFRKGQAGSAEEDERRPENLRAFIRKLKAELGVKKVLVWHALGGYWGGVRPGLYGSTLHTPVVSAGVRANQPDAAPKDIEAFGAEVMAPGGDRILSHHPMAHYHSGARAVGVMAPDQVAAFYTAQYGYLAGAGVDGVKVDVQCALETLAEHFGGRVALTAAYQTALAASVAAHFPDNDAISSMSHGNDALYTSRTVNTARASDDFWPWDPASHTIHVAACAYVSVFMGDFTTPDWDMFQSRHPMAHYHAAARAVAGCAVYVSDHPGEHDPDVLRKLVLPDGRVLRARLPGRPTVDCLFADPCSDQKTPLKIWNMNATTAVVGAFNCQGAAWSAVEKVQVVHDSAPGPVSGTVGGADIPGLAQLAGPHWTGDLVVYSLQHATVTRVSADSGVPFALPAKEYDVFTLAPVHALPCGTHVAAVGLVDMYNGGGAVHSLALRERAAVEIDLVGGGKFVVYASAKPQRCTLNGAVTPFTYEGTAQIIALTIPFQSGSSSLKLDF
ncbi:alkaline alpha galactosidase [Klebsormidium nitens]|uniref:galactinol--sucrose galactosyltransferase n=1 Tax=Klebsormidium nitens TaxID=105231 RepID=A0A1Y1IDZ3_KLENI|nr:alkaline alpha galactosidase [Klebsormidium nitens]|eukprot:GAQ86926.1 alkaline alpha galactosidase [Klebsormidium nitens]